jgi:transposase
MSREIHVRFWESAGVRFPCATHLPLCRQAQIYARDGLELERSTLSERVGGVSRLLRPLVNALRRYVMAGPTLHADDTPVPMLAPGKGETATARHWAYVRDNRPAGSTQLAAVWMVFTPDRKREHPQRHLEHFAGVIHADGFARYDKVFDETRTHAACWAHYPERGFIWRSMLEALARRSRRRLRALGIISLRAQILIGAARSAHADSDAHEFWCGSLCRGP